MKYCKLDGTIEELSNEEMQFGYRKSVIQGTKDIVVSVTVELAPGEQEAIYAKMADFNERRTS